MTLGTPPDNAQWYVEIEGLKYGPFSIKQIELLRQQGKLRDDTRATAAHLNGQWVPLSSISASPSASSAPPSKPPGTFQPPPRPSDLERPAQDGPKLTSPASVPDPTATLFETLQAVRERKSSRTVEQEDEPELIQSDTQKTAFTKKLLIGFVGLLLITGAGYLVKDKLLSNAPNPAAPSAPGNALHQNDAVTTTGMGNPEPHRLAPPPPPAPAVNSGDKRPAFAPHTPSFGRPMGANVNSLPPDRDREEDRHPVEEANNPPPDPEMDYREQPSHHEVAPYGAQNNPDSNPDNSGQSENPQNQAPQPAAAPPPPPSFE